MDKMVAKVALDLTLVKNKKEAIGSSWTEHDKLFIKKEDIGSSWTEHDHRRTTCNVA